MNGYFKCCACGFQWKTTGSDFSTGQCAKCNGELIDCEIGSAQPPSWWAAATQAPSAAKKEGQP